MTNPNLTDVVWRKSTHSDANGGACIEVADLSGRVAVRDSKDRNGPVLSFTAPDWQRFINSVKAR